MFFIYKPTSKKCKYFLKERALHLSFFKADFLSLCALNACIVKCILLPLMLLGYEIGIGNGVKFYAYKVFVFWKLLILNSS